MPNDWIEGIYSRILYYTRAVGQQLGCKGVEDIQFLSV